MTKDSKQGWGIVCIFVGVLILGGVARESAKRQEQSTEFDRQLNSAIDAKNNWRPGTMDSQYTPGDTWRLGNRPIGIVHLGFVVGMGLLIGGIWMIASSRESSS